MDILKQIQNNPFLLAPMAGITDIAFRSFMKDLGSSIVTTELVSANGLQHSSERTRKLMRICDKEQPVGIQIFGEDLDSLAYAAKECENSGAAFVDLNFGCPVNKVVKKGAGSAVLKDLNQLTKILQTVKSAINIPLTIKIRTGWTHEHKNADEVCHIAYNEGISWVAIHGRTRSQAYNGKADWGYIGKVKANAKLPVIGNGDLTSAKIAIEKLAASKCDAVMIGRGALKNPWIFKESLTLYKSEELSLEKEILPHLKKLRETYLEHFDERIALLQIKKFSSWFSSGYPGSAKFRKDLFSAKDPETLWSYVSQYFQSIQSQIQEDTSNEAFLMGGHG